MFACCQNKNNKRRRDGGEESSPLVGKGRSRKKRPRTKVARGPDQALPGEIDRNRLSAFENRKRVHEKDVGRVFGNDRWQKHVKLVKHVRCWLRRGGRRRGPCHGGDVRGTCETNLDEMRAVDPAHTWDSPPPHFYRTCWIVSAARSGPCASESSSSSGPFRSVSILD